jgi:predicted RNase H-like HicB family nuclease
MKSFVLRVVLERDQDRWRTYLPELEANGKATWASTKERALKNILEVTQMVIEDLLELGESLRDGITIAEHRVVAVTVE